MRDPERLLSSGSDAERELLESLRDERAPAHVRSAAWQGIAAGIAATLPASAAAAAAVSGSLAPAAAGGVKLAQIAGSMLLKWTLLGALGAGAVGGAIWLSARAPAPQPVARPQPPAAAPAAPAVPQIQPPRAAEPAAPEAPAPSKRPRVNALLAESALLQSARAELRAGELGAAERTLGQLQRRFPRGVLSQEREVLRIELLRARGDHAAAQRSAASFLRRHPESPHAAQLSQLLAAP